MKRWLLTFPLLLAGMVGLVRGEYVLLVVNTGAVPPAAPGPAAPPPPMANPGDLVGVIVESSAKTISAKYLQSFGQITGSIQPVTVEQLRQAKVPTVPHIVNLSGFDNLKLGNLHIFRYSDFTQAQIYATPDKESKPPMSPIKTWPTFKIRFETKREDPANKTRQLEVAEWALTHGLINEFSERMEKIAKELKDERLMDKVPKEDKDKMAAAVALYLKGKERLNAKLPDPPPETPWIKRLEEKEGFKKQTRDHYFLLHNVDKTYDKDVRSRLDHCEEAYRTFYFLFAMRNEFPPMPKEKLVIVLTQNDGDDVAKELRATLPPWSQVRDGFYAPRDGILYLGLLSRDPDYEKVRELTKKKLEDRFTVEDFLTSQSKSKPRQAQQAPPVDYVALAVATKTLECDAERMTVSHNASRQLVYAAGFLPPNVKLPEWIQYGMAGFYECTQGAIGPSPTTYNPVHLYNWKNLLTKTDGPPEEILKKVVTDALFREAQGLEGNDAALALAKARAAAWTLTYYLTSRKPDQLKAYCDELKKLPRDLDLDESVLLSAFARAVGAEVNRNLRPAELSKLARDWQSFIEQTETQEDVLLAFGIFDTLKEMKKAMAGPPMTTPVP